MSTDSRGFVYALEAVRVQAEWKLDALQRELADEASRLAELARERARWVALHQAALAAVRPDPTGRFDPAAAQGRLAFLVDAQQRIAAAEQREAAARAAHAELQARCQAAQLKLEAIDKHRAECLAEHGVERARLQAAAADQDWLARAAWRRADHTEESAQ